MCYINILPLKMLVVLMGLVLNYQDRSERCKIESRTRDCRIENWIIISLLQIAQVLYFKAVGICKCSCLCMAQGSMSAYLLFSV